MIDFHRLAQLKATAYLHLCPKRVQLRSVGSIPSAKQARCKLVVPFIKIRNPLENPLIRSNNRAGQSGQARDNLHYPSNLKVKVGSIYAAESPQAIDFVDEAPQIDVADTCHSQHHLAKG